MKLSEATNAMIVLIVLVNIPACAWRHIRAFIACGLAIAGEIHWVYTSCDWLKLKLHSHSFSVWGAKSYTVKSVTQKDTFSLFNCIWEINSSFRETLRFAVWCIPSERQEDLMSYTGPRLDYQLANCPEGRELQWLRKVQSYCVATGLCQINYSFVWEYATLRLHLCLVHVICIWIHYLDNDI